MPTNTAGLRAQNTALVRAYLRRHGPSTKVQVAEGTRLSYATASTLLNELCATGEVDAGGGQVASGGRPAEVYGYNAGYAHLLCACLLEAADGQAQAELWELDLLGREVGRHRQPLPRPGPGEVAALLRAQLAARPGVRAVGLGVPGVVEAGGQVGICDFERLAHTPLAAQLAGELGVPVRLGNDLTLTARGLARQSGLGPSAAVLHFPRSSPMGAGLVVGGQALHGATGFAGELSFLPPGFRQTNTPPVQQAALMVAALSCTLNPATVLLTGPQLRQSMLEGIRAQCLQYIPAAHLPAISYQADTMPLYLAGLYALLEETVIEEWSL